MNQWGLVDGANRLKEANENKKEEKALPNSRISIGNTMNSVFSRTSDTGRYSESITWSAIRKFDSVAICSDR